jgi:hypothetical protein
MLALMMAEMLVCWSVDYWERTWAIAFSMVD